MIPRVVACIAVLLFATVAFAQDPATGPALGYKESFQINYISHTEIAGGTYVNIINGGTHGSQKGTGPALGGPGGNICVNVYVYDPDEQPRSCCSCLLTPNAVLSMSGADLTINPIFGRAVPNSATVKLLAYRPPAFTGAGQGVGACTTEATPSTLGLPSTGFAAGMRAWATHAHVTTPPAPAAPVTFFTEEEFQQVPLSESELGKLAAVCMFFNRYGSNQGICGGCPVTGARAPSPQ